MNSFHGSHLAPSPLKSLRPIIVILRRSWVESHVPGFQRLERRATSRVQKTKRAQIGLHSYISVFGRGRGSIDLGAGGWARFLAHSEPSLA